MGTEAGAGAKPLTADRVTDSVEVMKAEPRAKPTGSAVQKDYFIPIGPVHFIAALIQLPFPTDIISIRLEISYNKRICLWPQREKALIRCL